MTSEMKLADGWISKAAGWAAVVWALATMSLRAAAAGSDKMLEAAAPGGQRVWLTFGLGLLVLIMVGLLFKPFLVISFDPVLAATLRLPAALLRNLMLVLLALTVVVSLQTVGVGLAAAMLVTPAATAYLLARRMKSMMLLSAALGALSSIIGLYISYYANIVSGSAIVLTATAFFLLAFVWKRGKR